MKTDTNQRSVPFFTRWKSETDDVAQAWLKLPGGQNATALHARAHRDNLARPRAVDLEFQKFWQDMQAILDIVLQRFEARYLDCFRVLDELLEKRNPGKPDAQKLRQNVPNNLVVSGYFFDRLNAPCWLELLAKVGFFKQAPEPDYDYEKGTVGFPVWPESHYLARVAGLAPDIVFKIALEIETDNPRVHQDLIDAALAMPPEVAANMVPRAIAWIELPYQLLLPMKLGALIVRLANGGQMDAALKLAGALLSIEPDPKALEKVNGGKGRSAFLSPRPHFDMWLYEEILKRHIPELVVAAGEAAFALLCNLLDKAIEFSFPQPDDSVAEDYSTIWRRAIDERSTTHTHGLKDALVSAVRDAAEHLAKNDLAVQRFLVTDLLNRRWLVFHRLALHTLRLHPSSAPDVVVELLTDKTWLSRLSVIPESAALLKEQFPNLAPGEQAKILSWIDEGPDQEQLRKNLTAFLNAPATDDDVAKCVESWRRDHLALLAEALPQDWRRRYQQLVVEYGPPQPLHPAGPTRGFWTGPTSPKSTEELRQMGAENIIAFLGEWKPTGEFMSSSPEGLGEQITSLVAADPVPFATNAQSFQGLDPSYVSGLFTGLQKAIKQKLVFPWAPVLELCRWVIDQPRQTSDEVGLKVNWVWTRQTIARLLSAGLEESPVELPFELRRSVWEVLRPLTDDPQPTTEDEVYYGNSNMDPPTLSINTTRGEAMHATIRYALWVRRHIERELKGRNHHAEDFDDMPEVREVLDRSLDPAKEPSLAIHAVYGEWFGRLFDLDCGWVTQNLARIFPPDENLKDKREVAWGTYVSHWIPGGKLLDLLRGDYWWAVNQLGADPGVRSGLVDPQVHLAQHFMVLYWRGQLSLDDPEGLLIRFYGKSSDALRAHALEFVGYSLRNWREPVPTEILSI